MEHKSPIAHLIEASKKESFEFFRAHMESSMLFHRRIRNCHFAIDRAIANNIDRGLYVEFGVAGGKSARLFGSVLQAHKLGLTGFDSFEGLEEDWTGKETGRRTGAFSTKGKLPEVPENVDLIKGMVQDTLPSFIEANHGMPFAFAHMDMDTYTPTLFALQALKPHLRQGSVILFDELYGYPGWKHHEYRALTETLDERDYKYISFGPDSVAIELVRTPR